jgi:hypothetical protein
MKKILLSIIALFLFASISFAATISKPNFVASIPSDVCLVNALDNWQDLPAVSTAAVLNSVSITTTSLVASATTYTLANGDFTDIVFPRNITADCDFATDESVSAVAGTLTITGYNQFGIAATESVSITTNAVAGSVCWSSITSLEFSDFTISGAAEANISLAVGTGLKIALSNNIQNTTDAIKVIEAGATSTTYTLNTTYDSISFASAPNGTSDYYVYYNARTNTARYKY